MDDTVRKYLQDCLDVSPPENLTVQELINFSRKFPQPFPIDTSRCETLLNKDPTTEPLLERNINGTYPVLHEQAVSLFCKFLEHKKKFGTEIEKKVYENMGLLSFVDRLFIKRAVVFYGPQDKYILLPGGGLKIGGWETIGTAREKPPLVLTNCLSYDEMKLSALLAVSSPSVFINDGNRRNRGVVSDSSSIETTGIIVGVVGTRLKKKGFMEWQDIVVSKTENTEKNGYGTTKHGELSPEASLKNIWAEFYGIPYFPLYEEVFGNKSEKYRYLELPRDGLFFDNDIFKKRVEVTAFTLLVDANHRASQENKKAYVHVVGFGLGVWGISPHQEKVFMDAFYSCFKSLNLQHISDVDFSWFSVSSCGDVEDGCFVPGTTIRLHFSKRNPHAKLSNDNAGKLLVVSYAWDSNSLPGNEYWKGSLASSGDPAAACSSQVPELQNPHINKKVSGHNLHIATCEWAIIHVAEYAKRKLAAVERCSPKRKLAEIEETPV